MPPHIESGGGMDPLPPVPTSLICYVYNCSGGCRIFESPTLVYTYKRGVQLWAQC